MDISNWINALSGIGALAAATMALFTLREMRKQRASSYKPELILPRQVGHWKSASLSPMELGEWSRKPIEGDDIRHGPMSFYTLDLFNIGFGAAKEIEVKWIYESMKAIDALNFELERESQKASFEARHNFVSIKSKRKGGGINLSLDAGRSYDYCLPASIEKEPLQIHFPYLYRCLFATHFYLEFNSQEPDEKSFDLPPDLDLKLSLTYRDIGGQLHTADYDVKVGVVHLSGGETPEAFGGAAFIELFSSTPSKTPRWHLRPWRAASRV